MSTIKRLTIWTLVLHFIIMVGIGHGIACVGLCEVIWFFSLFSGGAFENFSLSLTASYQASIGAVALFSLIGTILLLRLFFRSEHFFLSNILGIMFLWVGFFYLTHDLFRDNTAQISFYTGLPFLFCSVVLFGRTLKSKTSF